MSEKTIYYSIKERLEHLPVEDDGKPRKITVTTPDGYETTFHVEG